MFIVWGPGKCPKSVANVHQAVTSSLQHRDNSRTHLLRHILIGAQWVHVCCGEERFEKMLFRACLIVYLMEQARSLDSGHNSMFCSFNGSLFVAHFFVCLYYVLVHLMKSKDCWSPAVYLSLCLSAGCGRQLRECWSHPGKQREPAAAEPVALRASCFTATSSCSSCSSISFHSSGFPPHSMDCREQQICISFHGSGLSSHSKAANFHLISWILIAKQISISSHGGGSP